MLDNLETNVLEHIVSNSLLSPSCLSLVSTEFSVLLRERCVKERECARMAKNNKKEMLCELLKRVIRNTCSTIYCNDTEWYIDESCRCYVCNSVGKREYVPGTARAISIV